MEAIRQKKGQSVNKEREKERKRQENMEAI